MVSSGYNDNFFKFFVEYIEHSFASGTFSVIKYSKNKLEKLSKNLEDFMTIIIATHIRNLDKTFNGKFTFATLGYIVYYLYGHT